MASLKYFLTGILLLVTTVVFSAADKTDYYNEEKLGIIVTSGNNEFVIKLKSNHTTGYSWFLKEYDNSFFKPISYTYEPGTGKVAGAPGLDVWRFKVSADAFKVPQQRNIEFAYSRPWDGNDSAKQVVFIVSAIQ